MILFNLKTGPNLWNILPSDVLSFRRGWHVRPSAENLAPLNKNYQIYSYLIHY